LTQKTVPTGFTSPHLSQTYSAICRPAPRDATSELDAFSAETRPVEYSTIDHSVSIRSAELDDNWPGIQFSPAGGGLMITHTT
jgi:hypothetical protein